MNWPPTMHPLSRPVPDYSTDIAAAFAVDKPGWLWEFQELRESLVVMLSVSLMAQPETDYDTISRRTIWVEREWLNDKAQTYAWLRCLHGARRTIITASVQRYGGYGLEPCCTCSS
jgi:hypothetical protein